MLQNCPDEGEWSNFAAGRIPPAKVERLAAHLDDCAVCQATLRQLGRDSDTLLSQLQKRPAAGAYDDEPALRQALDRIQASFAPLRDDRPQQQAAAASRVETPFQTERFGAYEVLERLGSGGMGVVCKALQTHLDRMVALKILPEERLRDPGAVARFRREMKAVGKLDHPNIVRAYDAGEVEGKHFLAMELVDGVDLSRLAARLGALPLADACELVRQAAAGLEHARSHGMVHRDVKPSNLMLSANGQVKILDLGLAMLANGHASSDDLTAAEQLMGTLDYLAPEQAEDSRAVDIRADVYSLGCTLYRLIAGAAPFAGPKFNTPLKKVLAHARSQPEPIRRFRPEAPDALAAVLERMMAKAPENRFATPAEAAQALAPLTAGSNLPALMANYRRAEPRSVSGEAPTTSGGFKFSISAGTQPDATRTLGCEAEASSGPPRRLNRRYLTAAAAGALALLCGVIVVIKDRHGKELARLEAPEGTSVSIEQKPDPPAEAPKGVKPLPSVPKASPQVAKGAVPQTLLFDGKTFNGWAGDIEHGFRIEHGAIVGGSLKEPVPRDAYIYTTREYGDFELRLKFKLVGKQANGGVQFRSRQSPHGGGMIGYQADLGDGWNGNLFEEGRRRTTLAEVQPDVIAEALKPAEWNEYTVRCEGRRIQLSINGRKTVDYAERDERIEQHGRIGLQIHRGSPNEVWYKDIVIEELTNRTNNLIPSMLAVGPAQGALPAYTDATAAGLDFQTQGEYAGESITDGEVRRLGVQVVALGNGTFSEVVYYGGLPGDGWKKGDKKESIIGTTQTGVTVFKWDEHEDRIKNGALSMFDGTGKELAKLKKVERQSPTLDAKPPAGAMVLFDGTRANDFELFGKAPGKRWSWGGARSKQSFGSCRLHIEFRTPFMPTARGQARGNSGVFLQESYEVQVLDSFGLDGSNEECGGIFSLDDPNWTAPL